MIERSTMHRLRSATTSLALLAACGTPRRPLDQVDVVARIEAGGRIQAIDLGEAPLVLFDEEGQARLRRGSGEAVDVCFTAADVMAAADGKIAVSCSPLGGEQARVQIFGPDLALQRELTPPSQPGWSNPTAVTWPVVDRSLTRIRAVDDAVDVVFSPDGARLAVALEKGAVELHDTADPSAAVVTLPPGGDDQGPAVAFSPDGQRVAVASYWGQFRLFTVTGELLRSDAGDPDRYGRHGIAFAGERIVQARAGDIVLRDLEGKPTEILTAAPVPHAPFGPGIGGGVGDVAADGDRILAVDASGRAAVVLAVP